MAQSSVVPTVPIKPVTAGLLRPLVEEPQLLGSSQPACIHPQKHWTPVQVIERLPSLIFLVFVIHDAKEVFMGLGSGRAVCVYIGHGRPLFDEEHLAHLGDRAGLQPIQIHAAGDPLAYLIAAIPMDSTGAR